MFRKYGNDFFSIGGQVNNSSAGSEEDMERAVKAIRQFHMNTIAVPIYWYQIEPVEQMYNFDQIDMILRIAQENELKVVLLWFGTWKNGASHYVPEWVKRDKERFLWACNSAGARTRALSPIGMQTMEADRRTVSEILSYLKAKDEHKTVIAFQIENEPGLLGTPRDYSEESSRMFEAKMPENMQEFLSGLKAGAVWEAWKENGFRKDASWKQSFGLLAEEIFSAYYFSRYIESVAAAGKMEYELPMYVNVWVRETQNRLPGIDYPSGGATSLVLDLWKYFAPHIDCICPDIYFEDRDTYEEICEYYDREDNVLYIPESHASDMNALHLFRAVEKYGLSGIHCFAIDSAIDNEGNLRPECEQFRNAIEILSGMKPLLEKYRGSGRIYAVAQYEHMDSQFIDFGDFWGRVYFLNSITDEPYIHLDNLHDDRKHVEVRGKGLIVYAGNGEFYLAGDGYKLVLIKKDSMEYITSAMRGFKYLNARNQEYIVVEEGRIGDDGRFETKKIRCGDESDMGLWVCHDIGLVHAVAEL